MSEKFKIMFVMLQTMGDVILGTTICRELKRERPDCEIHFYVNELYDQMLVNNPYIDKICSSPKWHNDMLFLKMSFSELKYDVIYAPHQNRPECNSWHQLDEFRFQHLVDFYWKRIGKHSTIEDRECYLFPKMSDMSKAESMISFDVPRIAIHSTSGVATKDWPYFNELTEELRKMGHGVVQVGARSDRMIDGAVDFRGKMSLMELAAFISKCSVFIGLDSGVSYIADAMKVPTIVIQGSTDPMTSGPISNRVVHLFAKETGYVDCQSVRCHSNCRHEVNCNTKITVPMVMEKVMETLKEWKNIIPTGV